MKAINAVENFKYRIVDNDVFEYDVIHASATLSRADNTFGFSFINFSESFQEFNTNIQKEIDDAKKTFKKYGWPTIDVTRKSVEETAASIIKIHEIYTQNNE